MQNEHNGVLSPTGAWRTLLCRDPRPMCPHPLWCWALPVPWPWLCTGLLSQVGWQEPRQGFRAALSPLCPCPPSPPRGAAPLLPVHTRLSPLSSWQHPLCHPTPAARATPELAARVTACAAAHAQCSAVPVASPRPRGRGCGAGHAPACAVPPGARAGMAAGQGHLVPCKHRSIISPSSLCPCCRLCPSPLVRASTVGPWPEAASGPSWFCQELTAPHRGSVPGGLSPLGGLSPDLCGQEWLCVGHGARGTGHTVRGTWGSTSRRSAWLSTCRRLFLART